MTESVTRYRAFHYHYTMYSRVRTNRIIWERSSLSLSSPATITSYLSLRVELERRGENSDGRSSDILCSGKYGVHLTIYALKLIPGIDIVFLA